MSARISVSARMLAVAIALTLAVIAAACTAPEPTPAPTPAPTVAPTAAVMLAPTATALPTHTPTPQPTPSATATLLPTNTPAPTYTPQPTLIPTPTGTPRPTFTPRPAPTARPQRTAEREIRQLAWVADGIDGSERDAVEYLNATAQWYPALAERMLQKPWAQDDITRDEGIIIRDLYHLAGRTDEATRQRMTDVAISIIDMPFLDDVTFAEARAVMALHNMSYHRYQDIFRAVMSHPKVQDGITDQEAKVITVIRTPATREPEMIPHLLDGLDGTNGVYLEERAIQLPLTGETLLTIVRTEDQTAASMDYLEHAVRFNEKFMGAPLPTNYVALYFGPNAGRTYTAHNWYTHMAMGSDRDGPERKANVFAHEVAHYYFRSPGPRWIHEGAAEIITFVSEYERAGYPLETYLNPPCDHIKTLPASDPDEHKLCAYFLGGSFFIDLYRTLGEDAFLQGFRALYRMRLVDNPADDCFECTELNVGHVLEAFTVNVPEDAAAKAKAVLLKWYGPLP